MHEANAKERAYPDTAGGKTPIEAAHHDAICGERKPLEELADEHRRHDSSARLAHRDVCREPGDDFRWVQSRERRQASGDDGTDRGT